MMKSTTDSEESMRQLGRRLGDILRGGEVLELIGDVGAGKTTLTKGLAEGLGISEPVQSPTFTISRVYQARDGMELRHYDFYRLAQAGIMSDELSEAVGSVSSITVIEWSDVVDQVLPGDRLRITITPTSEESRLVELDALGDRSSELLRDLEVGA